jgi:hypothetical protein
MTAEFYQHLFTAQDNSRLEELLRHVLRKVSDEMNDFLCNPFTTEEVGSLVLYEAKQVAWPRQLYCRVLSETFVYGEG